MNFHRPNSNWRRKVSHIAVGSAMVAAGAVAFAGAAAEAATPHCSDHPEASDVVSQGIRRVVIPYSAEEATSTVTIPSGVTKLSVDVCAAQGQDASSGTSVGGLGGEVAGTVPVTSPLTLTVIVGSQDGTSGYGGQPGNSGAGYGGGLSGIFTGSTPSQHNALVVAGGGGGAGGDNVSNSNGDGNGGNGGDTDGAPGNDGQPSYNEPGNTQPNDGGGGATTDAPGSAGASS
jgi:hypothetical protein